MGGKELSEGEYTLDSTLLQLPPTCEKVKVSYQCPRSIKRRAYSRALKYNLVHKY